MPYPTVGAKGGLRETDSTLEVYRGQQRLNNHMLLPETVIN